MLIYWYSTVLVFIYSYIWFMLLVMKIGPSSMSSMKFLPNTIFTWNTAQLHRAASATSFSPVGAKARQLTILLVEHDFSFELDLFFQRLFYLKHQLLIGLHTKQKLATAALLHDFSSCKPSQLTEAIGTIDYGETFCHLGIGQDEVAIWRKKKKKEDIQPLKALL